KIGEKVLNVTGDLTADLHVDHRIQSPGRGHQLGDRSSRHGRGLIIGSAARRASPNDQQNYEEGDNYDAHWQKALHVGSDLTWAPIKMTANRAPALHRDLFHHAAQLAHSRDEFQSELPPLDAGGSALVRRP